MSLLLACFVLLFATAQTDARRFREVTRSLNRAFGPEARADASAARETQRPEQATGSDAALLAGFGRALEALGLSDAVRIEREPRAVRLRARASLFFLPGSAELAPGALAVLEEVGDLARALRCALEVTGHADPATQGSARDPDGLSLASARAIAAARYLIEIGAIAPQQIAAVARGGDDDFARALGAEPRSETLPLEFRFLHQP
jgi:chemotaxis protein MotB